MSHTIRQLEERHVSIEIKLLRWNDRMDLLALANVKGEVSLHRLTWQRVWCLRSDVDESQVTDMVWRPDGKILAISYSTGNVILVEVENKNILHTIEIGSTINCIDWHQNKSIATVNSGDCLSNSKKDLSDCMNESNIYLMDLPSLSSKYPAQTTTASENYIDYTFIKNQSELNILLIGTDTGCLHISIFGIFTCATIDISQYLRKNCKIIRSQMSDNLIKLYVTVIDENSNVNIVIIDSSVIRTHSTELFLMAMKYIHLTSLLHHLEYTMSSITEAWESILLEMDSKLSKYAANVPEGAVCADFLDLLMFGGPSDEMEEFLMQDLTDKGLKKLGHSIELSYSNIQKLLLTHMNTVGQNITYHLTELRGMARLSFRYKNLGLVEQAVTNAILANGSFLVKGIEVQQVINHSMSNYKAFFRWLYVVILRLMDEQIPPEIPKMTQQDLVYITEFLQNFDSIGKNESPTKKNKFNLERLGQYLLDAPLSILPNKENNVWYTFLEENDCFKEHNSIILHHDNKSLVQQQKLLVEKIHEIFSEPKNLISTNFNIIHCINCTQLDEIRMSQININENMTLFAFLDNSKPSNGINIMEITNIGLKQIYLFSTQFSENSNSNLNFLDVQFYTSAHLSVLVLDPENTNAYICQIPLTSIREKMAAILTSGNNLFNTTNSMDISSISGVVTKAIEGMSVSSFAVSGSRHVSVVLSENKHKVQLFEMEADEEEEEEEADTTANITQE